MHIDWTKHLEDQKSKDEFEALLRNNTRILRRLQEIVSEWEGTVVRQERSVKQYETPNWAQLTSHRNGNVEILQRLKDLLSLN